ncbi:MAG: hypothetical protein MUO78_09960 [candidate division Zixibacteria bacterium]|nr:hypothetical protein [candidate division Zixibacteria bacterium]
MSFWELLLNSRVIATLVWAGLIITIVLLFRKPIIERIIGLMGLKYRDFELYFEKRQDIVIASKKASEKELAFFLGQDLCMITFSLGMSRKKSIESLELAIENASKLGLTEDVKKLKEFKQDLLNRERPYLNIQKQVDKIFEIEKEILSKF